MLKKIALIYGKNEVNDAQHTKEVLGNELTAHCIPFSNNRQSIVIGDFTIYFIQIEKEMGFEKSKMRYDEIFATAKVLKIHRDLIKSKSDSVNSIPFPSQAIVDIMLPVLADKKEIA